MHKLPYATKRDAFSLLLLIIFTFFHFSYLDRIRIGLQADALFIFFILRLDHYKIFLLLQVIKFKKGLQFSKRVYDC